jgi:hypothetical protein
MIEWLIVAYRDTRLDLGNVLEKLQDFGVTVSHQGSNFLDEPRECGAVTKSTRDSSTHEAQRRRPRFACGHNSGLRHLPLETRLIE